MDLLIIVLIGFVIMWLVIVLPQRRRAAAHERMVSTINVGDAIVTAGGIHATVTRLEDDGFQVELAPGVEVRLARRAVAAVLDQQGTSAREPPG